MNRIKSIDIARGLVMVIMALDHVREFWHISALTSDPTDLSTTTGALFLTRWITHLCAPSFVFLAGVSAFISVRKRNNLSESRKFLLTRGIWLVLLEFTLINFALWFDIRFRLLILEVIGAIGFSFIILSFLLRLKPLPLAIIGFAIIFGHNLTGGLAFPVNKLLSGILSFLLRPGLFQLTPDLSFLVSYPVIPWFGIMLAGYGCGKIFELSPELRSRIFFLTGLAAIVLFTGLRFINSYGDPSQWTEQKSVWFTFLSFINVTKYPPSLLFTLLFTGLILVVLSISENKNNVFTRTLEVYGKVPFFYFILHLYIIHGAMFLMLFIQGFGTGDFVFGFLKNGRPASGGGVSLAWVWIAWLAIVAIMYPLCRLYGNYKAAHSQNRFLRYL